MVLLKYYIDFKRQELKKESTFHYGSIKMVNCFSSSVH